MFCLNRPINLKQWGRNEIDSISLTTFLKNISFDYSAWISIKNSQRFVGKGPTNNIVALVQIIAWRRPGDTLLFESVMVILHIYAPFGLNEFTMPTFKQLLIEMCVMFMSQT